MHLDEPPRQRQADPESVLGAFGGPLVLGEEIEHAWQHVVRNPDARIVDDNRQAGGIAGGGGVQERRDPDVPADAGELDRVVHDVGEDLHEAGRVDVDELSVIVRQLDADRQLLGGGRPAVCLGRGLDQRGDRRRLALQPDLPSVIRDTSRRSSMRRTMWRTCSSIMVRTLSTARGVPGEPNQLEGLGERRQRVAQLGREHGEERVLAAIRLPELIFAPPQRVLRLRPFHDVGGLAREDVEQPQVPLGRLVRLAPVRRDHPDDLSPSRHERGRLRGAYPGSEENVRSHEVTGRDLRRDDANAGAERDSARARGVGVDPHPLALRFGAEPARREQLQLALAPRSGWSTCRLANAERMIDVAASTIV